VSKSLKVRKTPWGSFAHLGSFPRIGATVPTRRDLLLALRSFWFGGFLPTPRGEIQMISPHHHSRTGEQQTTCAGTVGQNSPSFAPREKEKTFAGAKFKDLGPNPHHTYERKCM
jgi:hypothetical protein